MNLSIIRKIVYALPVSSSIHEMILEGLRLAFFAAVSSFFTFLISQFQTLENSEIIIMILTWALRSLDKWKYENDKTRRGDHLGLSGF